jgi:hypothetical protein
MEDYIVGGVVGSARHRVKTAWTGVAIVLGWTLHSVAIQTARIWKRLGRTTSLFSVTQSLTASNIILGNTYNSSILY